MNVRGAELLQQSIAAQHGTVIIQSHDNGNGLFPLATILDTLPDEPQFFTVTSVEPYKQKFGINTNELDDALYSYQLNQAQETLNKNGIVSIAGDGTKGVGNAVVYDFHGRQKTFYVGFAELAVMSNATTLVQMNGSDHNGHLYTKLAGPLDMGSLTDAYEERVTHIVDQYVDLLRQFWSETPWMISINQMRHHAAAPPSDHFLSENGIEYNSSTLKNDMELT